jgi:hypothetical protein
MYKPPFESKLLCYSFDYGNRSIIKEPLRKLLDKYNEQILGVMPFVNNNPYLLEFYIIFDCEKDEIIDYIKKNIAPLALKEHSELTIRYLLNQLGKRRFNVLSHIFPKDLDNFFENYFFFAERKKLSELGYEFDKELFPPNTIFFSYSHKNKEFVENVKNELKNYNLPVFIDTSLLKLGDKLNEQIEKLIKESQGIVFFIDENFYDSTWLNYEFEILNKYDKKKILILDKNYEKFKDYLYIKSDFTNKDIKKIVQAILRWYYE